MDKEIILTIKSLASFYRILKIIFSSRHNTTSVKPYYS